LWLFSTENITTYPLLKIPKRPENRKYIFTHKSPTSFHLGKCVFLEALKIEKLEVREFKSIQTFSVKSYSIFGGHTHDIAHLPLPSMPMSPPPQRGISRLEWR
jgi:hypothetical protein